VYQNQETVLSHHLLQLLYACNVEIIKLVVVFIFKPNFSMPANDLILIPSPLLGESKKLQLQAIPKLEKKDIHLQHCKPTINRNLVKVKK
jgi:hypothetical protein